ncbi:hypothetical protein LEMLEM_LOCUS17336, partial [Lemmus lemmus]
PAGVGLVGGRLEEKACELHWTLGQRRGGGCGRGFPTGHSDGSNASLRFLLPSRISNIRGSHGISQRSSSEDPVMMVYSKPEALNWTSDSWQ